MKNKIYTSKLRGVIIGTAFGDALGAPIEHLSRAEIFERYGGEVTTVNTRWYKEDMSISDRLGRMRGYGVITDDTLMTLSLVNVYCNLKRHIDAYDLSDELVKEIAFRSRYIPEFDREAMILERLFYAEKHIFNRHVVAHCEPREGGVGNAVNCGAAMYIAPVGVVNACRPRQAYDEAIAFATAHQLSYGLEAAGVMAACIAAAFTPDANEQTLVDAALAVAKDGTQDAIRALCALVPALRDVREDKDAVAAAFHEALLPFSPIGENHRRSIDQVGQRILNFTPSRFYSIEELPLCLAYLLLYAGEPMRAILDAVNTGRDTDSIGVLCSSLAGALYGDTIFDPEEIRVVDERSKLDLDGVCERFAAVSTQIIQSDIDQFTRESERIKGIL